MATELAVSEGGAPPRSASVNLIEVARQAEAAKNLGATLIASGLLPDAIRKPEQAVLVILKGQELDLPPVYALSHLVVVKGKPTMSAELMRALVQRAGHKIRIVETTRQRAVVEGVRRDDPQHPVRISFDDEDVRIAGLANQGGHKSYPAALKLARATSMLCRALFADAIGGVGHTPEELGAEVNGEGEVLSVPDWGRATQHFEEPVEEAEVVEEQRGPTPEHQAILDELARAERQIPPEKRPDSTQLWNYASAKTGNARQALQKLNGILDEIADEPDDETPEDDEAEAVPDFGDMHGAAKQASPQRARKSQIDLLHTLAEEINGADGVAHVETQVGKPLAELSRVEADRLIDEMTPGEERTDG
ncbi:MAG: hypothetical protein M3R38_12300 [Actinomycetota bacterium]|nr:hypothetical protein [Actinomycetota bacterium]